MLPVSFLVFTGLTYKTSKASDKLFVNVLYDLFLCNIKTPFFPSQYKKDLDNVFLPRWEEIYSEFVAYTEIAPSSRNLTNIWGYKGWGTIPLVIYSRPLPIISSHFPVTTKIVEELNNRVDGGDVVTVMFSVLQGGGNIKPHTGDFKGLARYHLGLEVPVFGLDDFRPSDYHEIGMEKEDVKDQDVKHPPIRLGVFKNSSAGLMEVYDNIDNKTPQDIEFYEWAEGESVLWDDTYVHFAENKSPSRRVVLFVDVVRPDMNWIARLVTNFIVNKVGPVIPLVKELAVWNEAQHERIHERRYSEIKTEL